MTSYKLYDILGIDKNASNDEIKKKYKKLAVHNHPDKGGDQIKFQEITNAYEILSDENKRKQYDIIGDNDHLNDILDSNDDFPFPGMYGMHGMHGMHTMHDMPFSVNLENIFQNFFNINKTKKTEGKHIEKNVKISLKDAYFGIKKKYDITITKFCNSCNNPCSECKGTGYVNKIIRNLGIVIQQKINCETCNSKGFINKCNNNCNICNGKGIYNIKENINVDILPGIKTGMKIIIEGKGDELLYINNNEKIHVKGNLILNINVEDKDSNHLFERNDNDLVYNLTLPYWKFLININYLNINHYKDNNLKIDFNEQIVHNKTYIFKNLGMPIVNSNNYGNLIIKFNITFPDKKLQKDEQEILLNKLKDLDIFI